MFFPDILKNLFITGGYVNLRTPATFSEVLNLSEERCTNTSFFEAPGDFPTSFSAAPPMLKLKTGEPVVCASGPKACYKYDFVSKTWQNISAFDLGQNSAVVPTEDGGYWIAGGRTGPRDSLYFDGVSKFTPGPNLPLSFHGGCMIKLNSDETLFVNEIHRPHAIYNNRTETWTWVPAPDLDLDATACGISSDSAGQPEYVVVAGGHYMGDRVLLFDISNRTWIEGPALPEPRAAAALIPHERSFLLLGGRGGDPSDWRINTDSILEFDPDNLGWIRRPETLPTPRCAFYYTLIDDEEQKAGGIVL